jgi:alpha-glucosidase
MKWWQDALIYQIYPKSFCDTNKSGTGDIRGIIEKLDYIKSLGIDAVWLTPVYKSPMVDNGYDIADYCSIDPSYGTMQDMEELIKKADERGIKIIMDLVYNHTSSEHEWFKKSRESRTNDKSDWYIWRDGKGDKEPTNWRGIFGGSAWTYDEGRGQYYLHTFAKEQPDLNWENKDVRNALFKAANFWLEKGVGGFRIDAITYIKKPQEFADGAADAADGSVNIHNVTANSEGILDFLREFKRTVFDGKDIVTVAEANGVAPGELKDWVGEDGIFNMLFEFSHSNIGFPKSNMWCYPEKWPLTKLKKALGDSQRATAENGWYPIFFENHDLPRCVNHFFPKGADSKLAAKAMAMVIFGLRGTPFIYQGQELGMTNTRLSDIAEYDDISSKGQYEIAIGEGFSHDEAMEFIYASSRDNARTPMQWNGGENAGFTKGKPWLPVHEDYAECNVEKEDGDKSSVLNFYRFLAKTRKNEAVLTRGSYAPLLEESEQVMAYERSLGKKKIRVLVNFSLENAALDEKYFSGRRLVGNYKAEPSGALRPLEGAMYLIEEGRAD